MHFVTSPMVSTVLTLAANGQYNLTVPQEICTELSLQKSQRIAVTPVCGENRRPRLKLELVPTGHERRSHHRALNAQSKRIDAEEGQQLTLRLPNQIAQALLLDGGETVEWGEPNAETIWTNIVDEGPYESLDTSDTVTHSRGATEASLKAYGEAEQYRTYLPQLTTRRLRDNLANSLPNFAAFRVECRDDSLCFVLDVDYDHESVSDETRPDPATLSGYPLSLQSASSRSQVNLNIPKQLAHSLSLKQRDVTSSGDDGQTGQQVELTVIRWQVDPLNPRRLVGYLTRRRRAP